MTTSYFSDDHRRQISAMMQANHCAPERADQAATLAVSAADQAAAAFAAALNADQSPDIGIRAMAVEVGAQLARNYFETLFAQIHALGAAHDLPVYAGTITPGRNSDHG